MSDYYIDYESWQETTTVKKEGQEAVIIREGVPKHLHEALAHLIVSFLLVNAP
jgi:hypothetical protein